MITASRVRGGVLCLRARIRSASTQVSNFVGRRTRSLDDRSYLTASSSWVCETLVKSSGELRSGALVVDIPVGDFHVSCESRFTSRGMRSSCWPPPPLGFWSPLPHDAAAFACDISSFHRRMVSARSSGSHPVGLECSLLLESC